VSRDEALAQLQSLGVPFGQSGDVKELKRSIVAAGVITRVFSPERQCLGKVRHATRDAAIRVARRMGKPGIAEYQCFHCRGWHNGNPPRSRGGVR